jgi:hypothetical protein
MHTGQTIWIAAVSITTTLMWVLILSIGAWSAGLALSGGWLLGISLTVFAASVMGFRAVCGGGVPDESAGQPANDNYIPPELAQCRKRAGQGMG